MELYKQLDQFNDYVFNDTTHTYTYKNLPVDVSVTQFIKTFVKPFDREYWLKKKAAKLNISEEELAAQWKEKADISTCSGTLFHKYMEESLAGKYFVPQVDTELSFKDKVTANLELLLPIGEKFIEDTKHKLIPVKSELTVGLTTHIAGQVDQIFYNTVSDKLEVWDWKTNEDIKLTSAYNEKLLKNLVRYDACEYYEYSLQLNLYKEILHRCGIETGDCYFVWFSRKKKTYVCYKCADMVQESKQLLSNFS